MDTRSLEGAAPSPLAAQGQRPTPAPAPTAQRPPRASQLGGVALLIYYAGVLLALLVLYGRGDVSTSGFIYQAF